MPEHMSLFPLSTLIDWIDAVEVGHHLQCPTLGRISVAAAVHTAFDYEQ